MIPIQRIGKAGISDKLLSENFVVRRNESNSCYYCFFCDCYFDAARDHIEKPCHRRKKEMPDRKFLTAENGIDAKPAFYYCNWCKVKLPTYGQVKQHVTREAHVSYRVQAQVHKMLEDNFIGPDRSGSCNYHCFTCDTFFDVVFDHVNTLAHKTQLPKTQVENFIVQGTSKKAMKKFYCLFCCCYFEKIFGHVKSTDHQINKNSPDKKFLINENNISATPASYFCNWCDIYLSTHGMLIDHVNQKKHLMKKERARLLEILVENFINEEKKDKLESYHCHSCDLHFDGAVLDHINSSTHVSQMDKTLAENFVIMDESNRYYCFFCDFQFDVAFDHIIKNKNHHFNMKIPKKVSLISQNSLSSEGKFYVCNLCNIPLYTFPIAREHVRIRKHLFKRSNPVPDVEMLQTLAENFVVISELRCRYYCLFCDSYFIVALEHTNSEAHECNKESIEKRSLLHENNIVAEPRSYHCTSCCVDLLTWKAITNHINRKKHTAKSKQYC